MRVRCPQPFSFAVEGPDGPYTLRFEPIDEWDGTFEVSGLSSPMTWDVLTVDINDVGEFVLSGNTEGSEAVWGDHYWFQARVHPGPPSVTLWGDRVIVRVDRGEAPVAPLAGGWPAR